MTTIQVPQLRGMDESHRKAIVSAFQSAQQALDAVQKSIVPATSTTAQQIAALKQQIAQILAAIAAIQKIINNLPSPGSTSAYPVVGTFKADASLTGFPAAVYESSPGVVKAADQSMIGTAIPIVGIATAAAPGGNCLVTTFGDVDFSGWAWTPDEMVFLDAAGAMTQIQPTSGFICPIGFAVSAKRIFVVIGLSIEVSSTPSTSALTLVDGLMQLAPISGGTEFQFGGAESFEPSVVVSFNGGSPSDVGDTLIQGGNADGTLS